MEDALKNFLQKERIAALSVTLVDGTSHSAALHFSSQNHPFRLFFQTSSDTKKIKETHLMSGTKVLASAVIGFSEKQWLTLQLEGHVNAILNPDEKKRVQDIHYKKYPNAKEYAEDPDNVILEFIPSWWRFSDYTIYPPKTISSEEIDL